MKPRRDMVLPIVWGVFAAVVAQTVLYGVVAVFGPGLTDWYPPPPPEMLPYHYAAAVVINAGAVAIGILVALRVRRRDAQPEFPRCAHCGYNLTGNISGICPECGERT